MHYLPFYTMQEANNFDSLAAKITPDVMAIPEGYQVLRRAGDVVEFRPNKIAIALAKAFIAVRGKEACASDSVRDIIVECTNQAVKALVRSRPAGGTIHIEDIQDNVELALMRGGHQDVARAYVLYREKQHQARQLEVKPEEAAKQFISVEDDGVKQSLAFAAIRGVVVRACKGRPSTDSEAIVQETIKNLYEGMQLSEVYRAMILAARTRIELDPEYTYVTAALLMDTIVRDNFSSTQYSSMQELYEGVFASSLKEGVEHGLLDPRLLQFNLPLLASSLKADRDGKFDYLGLQTLYDRYFLHINKRRIELPQTFFMRVAMGLAIEEPADTRDAAARTFYDTLSSFDFMSSTPTLFNAGTMRPQLSSCYLTTIPDSLEGIYDGMKENALLSKYAGGLGNDWTNVRAMGAHIKGTNGESQGVVPFLKVANDTAVAVNQGGKRKGAMCAYLESWHLDIEEFLELRKNTGDDRRRTHDMNTANWIPDLFMKRVMANEDWTLFSPSDVPDLHDLYGPEFEQAYYEYERKIDTGEIKLFKKLRAVDLWRKMLSMLFETGHPWITFKDPINIRSPQQHVGVVHSSNLCTEITLNTSEDETAVCNLGSVNLAKHITDGQLDKQKLRETVRKGMRMLDNVIDINYYPVDKARNSNLRHRPVGLGMMGFQDALYMLGIPYASQEAVEFADQVTEALCYYAYEASADLAQERGRYSSYEGSLWSRGITPLQSLDMLGEQRGYDYLDVNRSWTMDWSALRTKILKQGMRNSNCVAIAPTATISNIVGVDASIEPSFGNLSVKSNLSGEFTVINQYLVNDLKRLGLWDEVMVMDLKHYDGSLRHIERVPERLKQLYATAFEVEPKWLVEAAARRQKWIDQGQSLNIYMAGASGKKLDETYKLAWIRGLKTTYYLRTTSATAAEKSTVQRSKLNAVASGPSEPPAASAMSAIDRIAQQAAQQAPATDVKFCSLDDPGCEACQ